MDDWVGDRRQETGENQRSKGRKKAYPKQSGDTVVNSAICTLYTVLKNKYTAYVFCALLFGLFASSANAQVNVELYRKKKGVQGNIGLHVGGASGNSDFFTGGGAANISYNTPVYSLLLLGDGLLGFRDGESFSNEGLIHLRYTYVKPPRFQPETFVQSNYARSRKLTFRALAGAGLRTILFEDDTYSFTVGNSLMWEREHLDLTAIDPHPTRTSEIRSSNYVNFQIRKKATITLTGYYQFVPSEIKDFRLLGNLQIASRVAGPLQQVTTIRYRRDSRPPLDIHKNDLTIGTSFALTFGQKKKSEEKKSE